MRQKANLLLIVLIAVTLFVFVTFAQNSKKILAAAESDPIPVPAQVMVMSFAPSEVPVLSSDPQQAMPIGIGPVATEGDILRLHLNLNAFAGPVDLYFGILMYELDPANIYMLTPDLTLQPHSAAGIVPWKTNVMGSIDETLFGDIPVSLLPLSTYTFYLCATPAGQGFSGGFYLWSTAFEVKQAGVSYASEIEPLLRAKCSNCHAPSYSWAKSNYRSATFTQGHNGAFWSTLEASTIEEWISGGLLP
jgi:hypothetical protein